ncbi:MAG: hypothetical protein IPK87_06255 [Planctomycetes bacterium]|nr:hypothetical protein [Planctomycetota bacterium]
MVQAPRTTLQSAAVLVALLLFCTGCAERSTFPAGTYDASDRLKVDWGETYEERQLTEREYKAIEAFFAHAQWVEYDTVAKDIEGANMTINGTEWQVYHNSLCQDRKRRLEVEGVEFNGRMDRFIGFDKLIAWAESQ